MHLGQAKADTKGNACLAFLLFFATAFLNTYSRAEAA